MVVVEEKSKGNNTHIQVVGCGGGGKRESREAFKPSAQRGERHNSQGREVGGTLGEVLGHGPGCMR